MVMQEHLPFSWRDSRKAGITRRALAGKGYRRIVNGVYVRSDVKIDAYVEARASLLVAGPSAFVSHQTAARLLGGIVPDGPHLHASVPPGLRRSTHQEVVVHQSRRQPSMFKGLRVTSAEDTFLDLATLLPLVDLVVLGDSLVKRRRTTPERLVRAMDKARGRGIRPARRAAALVRSGVDSPMETRSRLLRVLSGLPELETDVRFFNDQGELVRRLDSADRKSRTAVEYDGRQHIDREKNWESDIGRREEFENAEWRIVVLVSKDIYDTPGRTIMRLERIFRARGMKVGPLRDEWRRHFPGRPRAA